MNATLYSLLEIRAVSEILDLWREGKHGLICPRPDLSMVGDLSELRCILLDWCSLLPCCPRAARDPLPGQQ